MQRLNCERFPCHFIEQDCSLCFCPFYPCGDGRTGGRMSDGAWSCRSCRLVHIPKTAGMILDALMRGESLDSVWRKIEVEL